MLYGYKVLDHCSSPDLLENTLYLKAPLPFTYLKKAWTLSKLLEILNDDGDIIGSLTYR